MNIKEEREDLLDKIESTEKLLKNAENNVKNLKTTIQSLKHKLNNLKILFKSERLRESGGHDSHYWLKISIETQIGVFTYEQWDSVKVKWPKELVEYIAKNEELFDKENLMMFCEPGTLEQIALLKEKLKIEKKLSKY